MQNQLTIDFSTIDNKLIINDWKWLIGEMAFPLLVTALGDLFFINEKGEVAWLEVGHGNMKVVAKSPDEFQEKVLNSENFNSWFMPKLVTSIIESGLSSGNGKLFSYRKLPILGGKYTTDNFELTPIEVHFSFTGQTHKQLRDLPGGTKVDMQVE